jgi:hypothetical protein
MAERTNAMVLKTIRGNTLGGSNPSPTAKQLDGRSPYWYHRHNANYSMER